MRASRANVAGLQETATTLDTPDSAIRVDCSRAPARGGSKTTASNRESSEAVSGFSKRSGRAAVTFGRDRAADDKAAKADASPSTACTAAFRAKGKLKV